MFLRYNKKRIKKFAQWQRVPYRVKPMSQDEHECATCGRHYMGNYCPQCGQSAKIGRYSLKNAFLLFIDVWGLGNRGMFRAIRDLMLRPGYMIRDYLRGMQMAYFPPFKMLFLICALSLLVETGVNIQGINRYELYMEKEKEYAQKKQAEAKADDTLTAARKEAQVATYNIFYMLDDKARQNPQLTVLVYMLLFSGPLYLMFRHCPAIPDLRFSECFVAMVYIINMLLIFIIIPSFLCFSFKAEAYFDLFVLFLAIIPIKQLSGYSYWGTIWRIAVALIPLTIIVLTLLVVIMFLYIMLHPELFEHLA